MIEHIKNIIIAIGISLVGIAISLAGAEWLPDWGWIAFIYLWCAVAGYGVALYRAGKL